MIYPHVNTSAFLVWTMAYSWLWIITINMPNGFFTSLHKRDLDGVWRSVSISVIFRPVSRECRYSAVTLISIRGMQVLFRYHDQYQGHASTLQLFCPVSGACSYSTVTQISVRGMKVLCSYPDQYQGHAGTLQLCWLDIALLSLFGSVFPNKGP